MISSRRIVAAFAAMSLFVSSLGTALAADVATRAGTDLADKATVVAPEAPATAAPPTPDAPANPVNYVFSTDTTGSLVDMSTGTTTLIAANQDDTASAVTPIGFTFVLNGTVHERFSVNSNGTLRFGATAITNTGYNPLGQAGEQLVTSYGADQRTHLTGGVRSKVIGTAPNRSLIVEWFNMQADFNAGGAVNLTYQLRLDETTGVITSTYGAMAMSTAGAADANSNSPQFGFSTGNAIGTVGSLTAAQSGTPAPTYNGAAATPVNNLYTAGAITVLTSATDGARRRFVYTPPVVTAPPGITFTGTTATTTTLNWTDSPDESGYVVWRSTDGVNFTQVAVLAENATSFVATGLVQSTNYTWRVGAFSEGAVATVTATNATVFATPKTANASGLWSAPGTWTPAGVPTTDDAVTIQSGATVTIDTAATAYSISVAGVLQFEQTTARTLTVATDVIVPAIGTLSSNPAGTQTGHQLSLLGNLQVDGTLDFSTNADTAGAGITFTGATSATFGGTGATTDVRTITVDKSGGLATVLTLSPTTFTVRGVTTDTVVGGWLVMTQGTFRLAGTFAGTSRVFASAAYAIPAGFAFWLDNPNYTVAGQNGNANVAGQLRVTQGVFNHGTLATSVMTASNNAVFTIDGGTVNMAGRFAPAVIVTYNHSAGSMNVATVGNSTTNSASFSLPSTAIFNFSGGTINLVQASTGATPIDYQVATGSLVSVAGTLRAGTAATATNFNFRVRGNLPNFVIDNTGTPKTATATAQVNLNATTNIPAGSTFVINGQICLVIGPQFINNGTLTGTTAGTRFYFLGTSGATTYSGAGTVTAPLASIDIDNVAGVTIDPAVNQVTVLRFNNFAGGVTGAGKLTIGNGGATTAVTQLGVAGVTSPVNGLDVPPVYNPGTGGVILLYAPELTGRTTGNEMPPSRTLTTLGVTNTNPITIAGGDVTVNGTGAGALAIGSSRIITGANTLVFDTNAGTITRTTGYVQGNFRRRVAAAGTLVFDVGTANGYTPVSANITAGTFPSSLMIGPVQAKAPGLTAPGYPAITRHWVVDFTGLTTDLTFSYLDPADLADVTEADLLPLYDGGLGWATVPGTLTVAANTMLVPAIVQDGVFTLGEPAANLGITKTDGATTVSAGGSTTYTITASNPGPFAVTGATLVDTFPASLTCTWTCVGAGGGTCTAAGSGNINDTVNLPAGASVTVTATCAIAGAATGTLSNTATIAAPAAFNELDTGDNAATDTSAIGANADLAITKTDGVTTVTAGGSTTYTITASNAGPSNATGATVSDTFPASLTCTWTCVGAGGGTCTASGSGNINDTVNLPAGASVTYTASCTIAASASGLLANVAIVAAPGGVTDPVPANNSATDTDTINASADLSITKTDGVPTVTAGGSTTYTITASNAGPSNAPGTNITDAFPAPLTCTWTCVGTGGGTCTAAGSGNIVDTVNLPSGGAVTYTATCAIAASAGGTLTNIANVLAAGGVNDPNAGNNTATDVSTIDRVGDFSITKDDGVTAVTAGGTTTYTIVATNAGPSDATAVNVTDTFPASETCTWTCVGAGGGTCTAAGSGNIADPANLPAGGSATYTATCTIDGAATSPIVNVATVNAPAGMSDPNLANNSATDSNTVGAAADASITKTDGVATVTAGGTLTYTIVASNAGPSPLTTATVTDTFPAPLTGCTWTCAAGSGGTCGAASGTGALNDAPTFAATGTVTYTATCTVPAATAGGTIVTNTATIATGAAGDPNTANNSASDATTVNAVPTFANVTGTKSVSGSFVAGGAVTYTIVLANSGSGAQADNAGNEFVDVLPAGYTGTGATATSGTATLVGNTVAWNGAIPAAGSVTITITGTIAPLASGTITNQGTINYDGDGNGTNESTRVTDDPSVGGAADGTSFTITVVGGTPIGVPATGWPALLAMILAMFAIVAWRRRAMR